MDSRADDDAGLSHGAKGKRDERPDGREDDRGIELLRRQLGGPSRPIHAERPREALPLVVAVPREREHATSLVTRDLRDDVRRRAEAVQPDPLRIACEAQGPIADQARAEQRRALDGGKSVGERETVPLVRDDVLGVAAV